MALFYGVKRKTGRVTPPHQLPAPRSQSALPVPHPVEPTAPELAPDLEQQAEDQAVDKPKPKKRFTASKDVSPGP